MSLQKIISLFWIVPFINSASGQIQIWTLEGSLGNNTVVIAPDQGGNYIVGGINSGHPDFDPGPAVYEIYSQPNSYHGFIARYHSDGQFDWAFRTGTENGFGAVNDIFVDDSNHFYVTGCFRAVIDFDPGPDTANLYCTGPYDSDGYFAKYNTDGTLIYVKQIYGQGFEVPKKIMQLPNGNLIVAGSTNNIAHFNPISGLDVVIPEGNFDGFLACYNPSGNIHWVKSVGGSNNDQITAMDKDGFGNIYIAGKFNDSIDVDPSASDYTLYAQSYNPDLFLMKCDSLGNFQWGRGLASEQDDYISSLKVNQFGEFFITGTTFDTLNLDPGITNFSLPVNNFNAFLARYKVTGDFLWGGQPQSALPNVISNGMAMDDSSNIYITGRYYDTTDFDMGTGTFLVEPDYGTGVNIYFAKYSRFGVLKFVRSIGGDFFDIGSCISVDDDRNIYLGGNFEYYVDFDIGPGTHFISATNSADAFYMKLKPDGYNHYLDIPETQSATGLILYPNPAEEEIRVQFPDTGNFRIEIFDLQGKIIFNSSVSSFSSRINTSKFTNGIYFIRVTGDSVSHTGKFVVKH